MSGAAGWRLDRSLEVRASAQERAPAGGLGVGAIPVMIPRLRWRYRVVAKRHGRRVTGLCGPLSAVRKYSLRSMALHATTIRFADRGYSAIARAADAQGISVSQYVREAALIRAVLDDLDTADEALHTAHDLVNIAREVRRLAEVDAPGPPRRDARSGRSSSQRDAGR